MTTRSQNKNKGFSLIELIIVLIITGVMLASITFRTSGAISNMGAEVVVSEIALAFYEAKQEAISGHTDLTKTTFNLSQALIRPHNGITVSTIPIVGANNCTGGCDSTNSKTGEITSICVSGNNFCFAPSERFTFERFSGRLVDAHAIFVTSEKRKMAVLITESGDHYVAELINNTWQTQRDLQKLFPKQIDKAVKQNN